VVVCAGNPPEESEAQKRELKGDSATILDASTYLGSPKEGIERYQLS